jgi:membrane-bound lytic murein transglycosylase D
MAFTGFTVTAHASSGSDIIFDHQSSRYSLTKEQIYDGLKKVADYSYNETAVKEITKNITLFTEKYKERFASYLRRSGKYTELMRDILKKSDIPEQIVFLPLIESGFNPYAYSRARAVGYWQFISSTAQKYGLKINWWRDERRDPVKSTEAAARYLRDLYDMFDSWILAMAAYNAGEGKISRALKKTKTDDYWTLLKTKHIRNETKNYIPKFIAASLIADSPEDFGFEDIKYYPPLIYDTVTLTSPIDLEVAAQCAETSVDIIQELNPELRRWCTPPDVPEYTLRIPPDSRDIFLENLMNIPEEERLTMDSYRVKEGDTFTKIAKKTGFPMQVILDLNNMEKVMLLQIGMKIYIPPRGKYIPDQGDKATVRKASYLYKKKNRPKQKI